MMYCGRHIPGLLASNGTDCECGALCGKRRSIIYDHVLEYEEDRDKFEQQQERSCSGDGGVGDGARACGSLGGLEISCSYGVCARFRDFRT